MATNDIEVKVGFNPQTKKIDKALKEIEERSTKDIDIGVNRDQYDRFYDTLKKGLNTTVRIQVDSHELDELARSKNLEFNVKFKSPEQALGNAARKNLDEYKKQIAETTDLINSLHGEINNAFNKNGVIDDKKLLNYRQAIGSLMVLTKKLNMSEPNMPDRDISGYVNKYTKLINTIGEGNEGFQKKYGLDAITEKSVPSAISNIYDELSQAELNPELIDDLSTTITKLEDIENLTKAFKIDFDDLGLTDIDEFEKEIGEKRSKLADIYKSFTPVSLTTALPEEVATAPIDSNSEVESVSIKKGTVQSLETTEAAVEALGKYISDNLQTIRIKDVIVDDNALNDIHSAIINGLSARFAENGVEINSIKPNEGVLDALAKNMADRLGNTLTAELSNAADSSIKEVTLKSNAKAISTELNAVIDEINKKLDTITIKNIKPSADAIKNFKKQVKEAFKNSQIVLDNVALSDDLKNSLSKIDGEKSDIGVSIKATDKSVAKLKKKIYDAVSSIKIEDLSVSPEAIAEVRRQLEEGFSNIDLSLSKTFSLDAVESSVANVKDKIRELYDVSDKTKYTKEFDTILENRVNKVKDKLIANGDMEALSAFNRAINNSNSKESFNKILQITQNLGSNIGGEFYTASNAVKDYETALSALNNSDKFFVNDNSSITEWAADFSKAISEVPIEHFNVDVAVKKLAESISKVLSSTSLDFQNTIAKAVAEAKTVSPSWNKKSAKSGDGVSPDELVEDTSSLQNKLSQKIKSVQNSLSKLSEIDISILSEDDVDVVSKYAQHLQTLKKLFEDIRRDGIKQGEFQTATQEFDKVQSDLYGLGIRENEIIINDRLQKALKQKPTDDSSVGDATLVKFQDLLAKRIKNVQNSINRLTKVDDSMFSEEDIGMIDKYNEHLSKLQSLFDEINQEDLKFGDFNKIIKEFNEVQSSLFDLSIRENDIVINDKFTKTLNRQEKAAIDLDTKIQTLLKTMSTYHRNNSKAFTKAEYENEFQEIYNELQKEGLDDKTVKKLNNRYKTLMNNVEAAGLTGKTAGERIKDMFQKFGGWTLVTKSLMKVVQIMKQVGAAVREVDTAMTDLRKVTSATEMELNSYFKRVGDTAYQIGSSMSDLISATASFSRLGYNLNEAEELGKLATVYKSVAEDLDITEASNSIISTLKAFEKTKVTAQEIVDLFNYVGNNFAISSAGIGEALQNSAASLYAANNTLEQSVALVTAANTVVFIVPRIYSNIDASR